MSESPQILRAILFDLDGTLIDSARLTGAIIDAMLAERGIADRSEPDLIRIMDSVGGERMIAAVMGEHCRDPGKEIAEFRARHAAAATPVDLAFPGVTACLQALADAGLRMAICSNKPQHLCDKILTDLDLARHFDAIIGARPDLPRKPAPEPALLAMAAIGAAPATSLYVGDSGIDVGTALAINVKIAVAGWGYGLGTAITLAPRAPVFASMAALTEHILDHGRTGGKIIACPA